MIEQTIAAHTSAINENTAAIKQLADALAKLGGGIPAPVPAAPAAEEKKPKGGKKAETPAVDNGTQTVTTAVVHPTIDALREKLKEYMSLVPDETSVPALKGLNAKFGTKRLSEAPEDKRAEIIAALQPLIDSAKAAKAPAQSASDQV